MRFYCSYVGFYDGIFRLNRNKCFSRELLGMWLWDVCGTGGTFRDAYSSWSSKSYATSASFHRIGTDNYPTRQLNNQAFTTFLKKLTFHSEKHLVELFTCSDCETTDYDNNRILSGVVMDGTALGILGTLPQFVRPIKECTAVPRVPDRQYLIRKAKLRAFIDTVLVSAKSPSENNHFVVLCRGSIWSKRNYIMNRLFGMAVAESDEAYLASSLLKECFSIYNLVSDVEQDGGISDHEVAEISGRIIMKYRIRDIDVRRTIVEFGRCFLSGPIVGGSLRSFSSISAAQRLSEELIRFSKCNHLDEPSF